MSPFPFWSVLPFAVLLLSFAACPLLVHHWWERNYPKVSFGLGGLTALYMILGRDGGGAAVFHAMVEYAAFIALIGSLFIVSAGIHVHFEGKATAEGNTVLLAVGGLLANLVGTTGASMLLIRPFLRLNRARLKPHLVVFFIFVVSNLGGALTPIGDPPLFLGYLKGVPFFWMLENATAPWMLTMALILAVFYAFERISEGRERQRGVKVALVMRGQQQVLFLAAILGLVLVQKAHFLHALPHAAVSLTVATIMGGVAWWSLRAADKAILEENEFNWHPFKEVAILFVGVFLTMIPALGYLGEHAKGAALSEPWQFYVGTGVLSAVLDNAPTYLTFLSMALGRNGLTFEGDDPLGAFIAMPHGPALLEAISLGAVFWGAMTYIGNGPNFMVKSIAQHMGAPCPTFVGYLFKYAIPLLLPVLLVVALMFGAGWIS